MLRYLQISIRAQLKFGDKFRDFFIPTEFNFCGFISKPGMSLMMKFLTETLRKSSKIPIRPCPLSGQIDIVNASASETWRNILIPGIYNHEVHLKFLNDNFTIRQSVTSETYETSLWVNRSEPLAASFQFILNETSKNLVAELLTGKQKKNVYAKKLFKNVFVVIRRVSMFSSTLTGLSFDVKT